MGDKKIFDFDAFYQAHYGEQLQREKEYRLMKQKLQQNSSGNWKKWEVEIGKNDRVFRCDYDGAGILHFRQYVAGCGDELIRLYSAVFIGKGCGDTTVDRCDLTQQVPR